MSAEGSDQNCPSSCECESIGPRKSLPGAPERVGDAGGRPKIDSAGDSPFSLPSGLQPCQGSGTNLLSFQAGEGSGFFFKPMSWFFLPIFSPKYGGRYCLGERKRFRVCNAQLCPAEEPSFRQIQCSRFDHRPYKGKLYKWSPVPNASKPLSSRGSRGCPEGGGV